MKRIQRLQKRFDDWVGDYYINGGLMFTVLAITAFAMIIWLFLLMERCIGSR